MKYAFLAYFVFMWLIIPWDIASFWVALGFGWGWCSGLLDYPKYSVRIEPEIVSEVPIRRYKDPNPGWCWSPEIDSPVCINPCARCRSLGWRGQYAGQS